MVHEKLVSDTDNDVAIKDISDGVDIEVNSTETLMQLNVERDL